MDSNFELFRMKTTNSDNRVHSVWNVFDYCVYTRTETRYTRLYIYKYSSNIHTHSIADRKWWQMKWSINASMSYILCELCPLRLFILRCFSLFFFSFAKNRKSAESMKSSDKHLAIIERIQISFNGPGNEANNKSDPLQCDDRQIYRFWLVLFQGRANLHVGDNFTMNSM